LVTGGGMSGGIESIFQSQYLGTTVSAIARTREPNKPNLRLKAAIQPPKTKGINYKSQDTRRFALFFPFKLIAG
jgi:hypothetical protein